MHAAQQRDAVRTQKFHFRKSISTMQTPDTPCMSTVQKTFFTENDCEHRLMSINEIINGSVCFLVKKMYQF